jgi:hypothetical protein
MRFTFLLFAICLFHKANCAEIPQNGSWVTDNQGEYIISTMQNAPFPHKSRKNGHTYNKTFLSMEDHYNDNSVGILIPPDYNKSDSVDLIIHFHGWGNNVAKEIQKFNFRNLLAQSGKNVIMLLPQGPENAQDSTCGKIEDPDGLKKLVYEVLEFLFTQKKIKTENIGKIILSGHSGGYRPVAFGLDIGGLDDYISEVYLFDAAYDYLDIYTSWVKKNNGRLISICTKHLFKENIEIMRNLQKIGAEEFSILLDDDVTSSALAKRQISFIFTSLKHNEVISKTDNLSRFLESGSLKDRKPVN